MNPVQGLYFIGLQIDKKLTKSIKLSRPVISVGNISVGGRAKTPMVISLCRLLKEKGLSPVVLTRGYARKSKRDIWLLPETLPHLQIISVDESGDEAVEIFLRAEVPVLVSANRAQQATSYLQRHEDQKTVFILDDGFQHWKLQRDIDLVLLHPKDYKDSLLPTGRLREAPSELQRADLVLELEKDIKKKMILPLAAQKLDPSTSVALTTRAGSQKEYGRELSRQLNFEIELLSFRDHLASEVLKEKLYALPRAKRQLLLGMKEAVKLLSPQELLSKPQSFYPLKVRDRSFEVYLVDLELEWNQASLAELLQKRGIL